MNLPPCDCTAQCGSNPDIDKGKCTPCADYVRRQMLRRAHEDARRIVSDALMPGGADPIQLPRAAVELISTVLQHSRN